MSPGFTYINVGSLIIRKKEDSIIFKLHGAIFISWMCGCKFSFPGGSKDCLGVQNLQLLLCITLLFGFVGNNSYFGCCKFQSDSGESFPHDELKYLLRSLTKDMSTQSKLSINRWDSIGITRISSLKVRLRISSF